MRNFLIFFIFFYTLNLSADECTLALTSSNGTTTDSLIVDSVRAGDLLKLKTMLFKNPDIDLNAPYINGNTLLHFAVFENQWKVADFLLSRKDIKVNLKNNDGITPLLAATHLNHIWILKTLLDYSETKVNLPDMHNTTALMYAIENKFKPAITLILNHKKTKLNVVDLLGENPLSLAVLTRNYDILKSLLDAQMTKAEYFSFENLNSAIHYAHDLEDVVMSNLIFSYIQKSDTYIRKALFSIIEVEIETDSFFNAVFEKDLQTVKAILTKNNININKQTEKGFTALILSIILNDKQMVKFFLDQNDIDVNLATDDKVTPLMFSELSDIEISKMLLKHKNINVNLLDDDKRSVFLRTILKDNTDLAILLLDKGDLELNYQPFNIEPEIIYATQKNQIEVVKKMVDREPDIYRETKLGHRTLQIALDMQHTEIVKILDRKVRPLQLVK